MGWAVVFQWFGARRRELQISPPPSRRPGAFALVHAESCCMSTTRAHSTPRPQLRRHRNLRVEGRRDVHPPPFHQWDGSLFGRYALVGLARRSFLPYLGLAGIVGFVWLGAVTAPSIRRRALPGQALSVGWIIAYASIGGVTNLALFAGFQLFRANRAAFHFGDRAVFVAVRLSQLSGGWPAWRRFAVALLVAGFGVFEQLPRRRARGPGGDRGAVRGDWQLGREMEAALPRGAMVFQLPVLGSPRLRPAPAQRLRTFSPVSRLDTLRFNYGAAKLRARPLAAGLGSAVAKLVPARGLRIRRPLYQSQRLWRPRGRHARLQQMGYARRIKAPGNQVVVFLDPPPNRDRLGRALCDWPRMAPPA